MAKNTTLGDIMAEVEGEIGSLGNVAFRCKTVKGQMRCTKMRRNIGTKIGKREVVVFAHQKSLKRSTRGKQKMNAQAKAFAACKGNSDFAACVREKGGVPPTRSENPAAARRRRRQRDKATQHARRGASPKQEAQQKRFAKAARGCGGQGFTRKQFNNCMSNKLSK